MTGDPSDTMVLLRDGVEIGRSIGTGVLVDTSPRPDGVYGYRIERYDASGNEATSATVTVTIDTTPPGSVSGLALSASGVVTFNGTSPSDFYEYQIGATGGWYDLKQRTWFTAASGPIGVRAMDTAGNFGPESWIAWRAGGSATVTVGTPTPPPVVVVSPTPQGPAALGPKAQRAARVAAHARALAALKAQRQAHLRGLALSHSH